MQAKCLAEWSPFPRRAACVPERESVTEPLAVVGKEMLDAGVGEMMSLTWGSGAQCCIYGGYWTLQEESALVVL